MTSRSLAWSSAPTSLYDDLLNDGVVVVPKCFHSALLEDEH